MANPTEGADTGVHNGEVECDNMTTLTYKKDVNGFVAPLVKVTLTAGREFYLCHSFAEVQAAMRSGDPFTGYQVRGMAPHAIIVNPPHVATVEDMHPS